VTEIRGYSQFQVMNSKLSERKTEKNEIQVLNCDGELKADENWMSAETSWVYVMLQEVREIWRTTGEGYSRKILLQELADDASVKQSIMF